MLFAERTEIKLNYLTTLFFSERYIAYSRPTGATSLVTLVKKNEIKKYNNYSHINLSWLSYRSYRLLGLEVGEVCFVDGGKQ